MNKTQLHNLKQNIFIFIPSSLPTATWVPFPPSLTSRGWGSLWKQGPRQRGRRRSGWSRIECEEDRPLSVGERETNLQFTSETFKLPGEKTQLCTELGRAIKKFVSQRNCWCISFTWIRAGLKSIFRIRPVPVPAFLGMPTKSTLLSDPSNPTKAYLCIAHL